LESIVDKILTNNKLDLSATISRKSVKEILSGEAAGKSFDLKSHLKAAANVDTLFSNAIKKWDFELDPNKNNASLQDRTYLYAPMEHDDRIMPVKLTVKKYKDIKTQTRLYSLEAIGVDMGKKIGEVGNLARGFT